MSNQPTKDTYEYNRRKPFYLRAAAPKTRALETTVVSLFPSCNLDVTHHPGCGTPEVKP